MQIIVKTTPQEVLRARQWWRDLEIQWKMAYNEAVFGKGATMEPPTDDEMMKLLIGAGVLRFAGPTAAHPNTSIALTNMSGLIPLYQLRYLSFTNMHITHVRELARFTELRSLFIYENRIESLEGVEKMIHMEEIYAQNNKIKDLKPLAGLTKLKTLNLVKNQITKLDGLTEAHSDHLNRFFIQPNENLPDREIIKFQNQAGILCRQG